MKQITTFIMILIAVNFFITYSITVPLPYIINIVLELKPEYFGIIEAAFPIGMIIGAVLIKRILEKNNFEKIFMVSNFVIALSMIFIGLPVIPLINLTFFSLGILIYYIVIMIFLGIAISFIDIPIIYMLQTSVSEEYRGRVLGIVISIGRIVVPMALIISGWLINVLPASFSPLLGGVLYILFIVGYIKNNNMSYFVNQACA